MPIRRLLPSLGLMVLLPGGAGAQGAPLRLEQAISMALRHAPRLAASRAAGERAAEAVQAARAERYPSVALDGSLVRFEDPMIVRPLHAFSLSAVPEFDETLVQASASVGFDLFDGGARGGRLKQSEALHEAADAATAGDEQALIQATVEAFLAVRSAEVVRSAQTQRLIALRAEADRVSRFLAEGRAARVETLRVGAALAAGQADSIAALGELDVARARMAALISWGGDPSAMPPAAPVRLAGVEWPERDAAVRAAVASNPALEASQHRVASARAARETAQSGWWPRVRLEGRTVTYGATGSGTEFTTEWQAGLRVSYPLYTGGARSARVREAEAAERELAARHRELELSLQVEVDRALARGAEGRARTDALEAAVGQLAEVVRTERLALDEGAGVQSDYLRAEADLAVTRAALARSRHAAMLNRVELARLMGRLTEATLPALLETVP